jgi:hypothetical protein
MLAISSPDLSIRRFPNDLRGGSDQFGDVVSCRRVVLIRSGQSKTIRPGGSQRGSRKSPLWDDARCAETVPVLVG